MSEQTKLHPIMFAGTGSDVGKSISEYEDACHINEHTLSFAASY